MYQVLLLTENILANRDLQEKLQLLNDEVWCSSKLLGQVKQEDVVSLICQQFQIIIFSNTICDKNIQILIEIFSKHPIVLLRETDTELNEEEKNYWRAKGLHEWIGSDTRPSEVREKMVQAYKKVQEVKEQAKYVEIFPFGYSEDKLAASKIRLTGREKRVLAILSEAKGGMITRKELCERLWSNGHTASNMSQLSCIIRRVQQKFEDEGVNNLKISTHWGKGYQLETIQKVPKVSTWI